MDIKNIEKTKQMSALLLEQAEGYIKNRKINGFYIIALKGVLRGILSIYMYIGICCIFERM